jgi:hypothetical protein
MGDQKRMRVFENRVLKGPKRTEVTGGWRKLDEELHNLYSLPGVVRMIRSGKMRWAGCVTQERSQCKRRRKNITMKTKRIWEDVDWIQLDKNKEQWLAVVRTVMNLQVP